MNMETSKSSFTSKPQLLWWRENLDFILTALLILFLVRFYCIEFFLIPSQSMHPTLYGHPNFGDRIVVNRASYELNRLKLGKINRWDVLVFKFPLDTSRNFIKRTVGLPHETIKIDSSNILINGKISQKPKEIQKSLFFENGRHVKGDELSFLTYFQQNFLRKPGKAFQYNSRNKQIHISALKQNASAEYLPNEGYHFDEDTKAIVSFIPDSEKGTIQLTLGKGEDYYSISLRGKKDKIPSSFHHKQNKKNYHEKNLQEGFEKGKTYTLEFTNLDGKVSCLLNNQPLFPSYSSNSKKIGMGGRFFKLDFFQTQCKLLNIRVFYDIRYTKEFDHTSEWSLKDNEYFVCGDNSSESDDSRSWRKFGITVTRGRKEFQLEGEAEQQDSMWKEKFVEFVDCFGKHYSFKPSNVKASDDFPFPTVPRRYVIGKALFVVWPPERIKIIR